MADKPTILCLNGAPRAGKTTLTRKLEKKGALSLNLSAPFRHFLAQSLDIGITHLESMKDSGNGSIRRCLIEIADAVEKIDENVWIKCAMRGLEISQIYVLDSIGKKSQWEWVVDYAHHVGIRPVLVKVGEYKAGVDVFYDGRHNIHPGLSEWFHLLNDYEEPLKFEDVKSMDGFVDHIIGRLK